MGITPKCDQHRWLPTGRQGVHVEFPTTTQGVKQLFAIYWRCAVCRQDGFTQPGRTVIYTWAKEDAE